MLVPEGPEWAGLGDAPQSAAGVGAPGVADPAGMKLSTPKPSPLQAAPKFRHL